MRRTVVRLVRRVPAGARLLDRRSQARLDTQWRAEAQELVSVGLIDPEWYAAQQGEPVRPPLDTAWHYLTVGRFAGRSPHPLVEPRFLRPGAHKSGPDVVVEYARGRTKRDPHPLFDEKAYLRDHPEAASTPGRGVGHFTRTASATTPLPVPDGAIVERAEWGPWRDALVAELAAWSQRRTLRVRRYGPDFDVAREQAYRASFEGRQVPPLEHGPVASVVMPVRDREALIGTAIESVLAQTMPHWELVVVDDGSTDGTADVVRSYAERDPRVRLLTGPSRGVGAARNTAIEAARGEIITFLDSDNVWDADFLRLAVLGMRDRGARAAYAALRLERVDGTVYRALELPREALEVTNHVDMNVLVLEKSVIDEVGAFDTAIRRWVDFDLVLRVSAATDLVYLPFVGAVIDERDEKADRITLRESDGWQWVVLNNNLIDWDRLREELPQRVPGRVSVLIPTLQDWRLTTTAVAAVLRASGDADVEVVVLDNGSDRVVCTLLHGILGPLDRVRVVSVPVNYQFALGSNLAFAASTGSTVVFLNNDTEVTDGWLAPLVEALERPSTLGAQPLLVYPDGDVQCAGVWFPGGDALPSHFLAHHPVEDAQRCGDIDVHAVTGAALALRAEDVVALRGFDPLFVNGWEDVDLCLRLEQERPGGTFRVVMTSVVVHHESKTPGRGEKAAQNRRQFLDRWSGRLPASDADLWRAAGLELVGLDASQDSHEQRLAVPRPVLAHPRGTTPDGLPSLRWSIKTSATPGRAGDHWGDTHFAADLAAALGRLGQQAGVDRRATHVRPTSYLDEVVLVLRGRDAVAPQDGAVNVLWVISHPDSVTDDELRSFDLVLSAGPAWGAAAGERAGVAVRTLLQATDPSRFSPGRARAEGDDVLFVGNSRGQDRVVVTDALAAGLDLALYGQGWSDRVPDGVLRAESLPNAELGAAYASAGVVLCDHWPDMAAGGFLSNRLFDAVASGARVVSDPVVGLEDVFGASVRTFAGADDLRRLVVEERATSFPDDDARVAAAARVAAEHSFDARARALLEAVVEALDHRSAR